MKRYLYFTLIILFILSGCSGKPDDIRLLDISKTVSDQPKEALVALEGINKKTLSQSNQYFYDFLSIKAKDKAYITHSSDSLILNVINYYSKHKKSGLYPEALYYGGRVYRDLGDGPTALNYFQDALDELSGEGDNALRGRILSQIGSLLNSIRLYDDATRYIKAAIQIEKGDTNSIKLMRDYQLLGAIYLHLDDFILADSCFNIAYDMSKGLMHEDSVINKMYLAGTNLHKGNVGTALENIQAIVAHIPNKRKDIIHAYASQIYNEAGLYDSVYKYAKELIKSKNNNYRKNGYSMLLSPNLRGFSSMDSLLSYSLKYRVVLDEYLSDHNANQMLIQTSLYNYQIHERKELKATQTSKRYMYAFCLSSIVVLILIIIILYFRNKTTQTILQYHEVLEDLALLRKSLDSEIKPSPLAPSQKTILLSGERSEENISLDVSISENKQSDHDSNFESSTLEDKKQFENGNIKDRAREQLKKELLELQKEGLTKNYVPETLKTSSVYEKLQDYIRQKKLISDNNAIWEELEIKVLEVSPKFKERLYLLAGERLKQDAYHLALLIKCGIRPSELSILTGRSKGAISSRRGYLCSSIFGEKYGASVMDDIILLL